MEDTPELRSELQQQHAKDLAGLFQGNDPTRIIRYLETRSQDRHQRSWNIAQDRLWNRIRKQGYSPPETNTDIRLSEPDIILMYQLINLVNVFSQYGTDANFDSDGIQVSSKKATDTKGTFQETRVTSTKGGSPYSFTFIERDKTDKPVNSHHMIGVDIVGYTGTHRYDLQCRVGKYAPYALSLDRVVNSQPATP